MASKLPACTMTSNVKACSVMPSSCCTMAEMPGAADGQKLGHSLRRCQGRRPATRSWAKNLQYPPTTITHIGMVGHNCAGTGRPVPRHVGRTAGASSQRKEQRSLQMLVLAVVTFGALVLFATENCGRTWSLIVAVTLAPDRPGVRRGGLAGLRQHHGRDGGRHFRHQRRPDAHRRLDHLIRALRRLGGRGERRLIGATVLLVGLLSSIMNNVGAAIIMMPAATAVARDTKVRRGRLLIPLAFGSLLGGLTTAMGTPPNLLINTALVNSRLRALRAVRLHADGAGRPGRRCGVLGPIRAPDCCPAQEPSRPRGERPTRAKDQALSTEVLVAPPNRRPPHSANHGRAGPDGAGGAAAPGRRPPGDGRRRRGGAPAAHGNPAPFHGPAWPPRVDQGHAPLCTPSRRPTDPLRPDPPRRPVRPCALLVEGHRDNLLRAVASPAGRILAEVKHPPEVGGNGEEIRLAEATLAPRSALVGQNAREPDFYHRYGLTVIGIRRHGETIRQPLARVRLRFGDTLLLRGPRTASAGWGPTPTSCCWSPWKTRRPTTAAPAGPSPFSPAPSGWRPSAACTYLWPPPWAPWPWCSAAACASRKPTGPSTGAPSSPSAA